METPTSHPFTNQHLHDPIFAAPHPHALVSQPELDPLHDFHFDPQLETQPVPNIHVGPNPFEQDHFGTRPHPQPRFHEIRSNAPIPSLQNTPFNHGGQFGAFPRRIQQKPGTSSQGGQMFGILMPQQQAPNNPQSHTEALGRLQNEIDLRPVPITDGGTTEGHFSNMKLVPDPPHLEEWRQRLFDINETITLTEDE